MNTQVENKENVLIKNAIYGFKKFIKENSKPAEKDPIYGNKEEPYLNAIDFAIYATLRGADFSKGLHSKNKAEKVKNRIISQTKWFESHMKQKIKKAIEMETPNVSEEDISYIYNYIIDKI